MSQGKYWEFDHILRDPIKLEDAYEDLYNSIIISIQGGVRGEIPARYRGGVFLQDEGNRIFDRCFELAPNMTSRAAIIQNKTQWNDRYDSITREVYVGSGE